MSYIEGHEASGIKVGDTVKVTRISCSYENGWGDGWAPDMTDFVSEECVVVKDRGVRGFELNLPTGGVSYGFPYFVLEKVEPKPTIAVGSTVRVKDPSFSVLAANCDFRNNVRDGNKNLTKDSDEDWIVVATDVLSPTKGVQSPIEWNNILLKQGQDYLLTNTKYLEAGGPNEAQLAEISAAKKVYEDLKKNYGAK